MANKTSDTAAPATGTDVAIPVRGMEVAQLDELDEILRTGELNAEVVDDPGEISRSIIDQLLGADSDEALQDFGNAQGWKELIGVPVELHLFEPVDVAAVECDLGAAVDEHLRDRACDARRVRHPHRYGDPEARDVG